jgi:hypothetical protein
MPAGDRKYLLLAKRRLTFTSSSVVAPFLCCSSRVDDRWYTVPRRPLTVVSPLAPPCPVLTLGATADDAILAAADILETINVFSVSSLPEKMHNKRLIVSTYRRQSAYTTLRFATVRFTTIRINGPIYGDSIFDFSVMLPV